MKKLAVGIDIGGTNTVVGLVERSGATVAQLEFKTGQYPLFDNYVERLANEIDNLRLSSAEPYELAGIGIGAPNANHFTGNLEDPANLRFYSGADDARRQSNHMLIMPIGERLKRYFPTVPVIITNDANAAAVGEMVYGGAKGMKDFIVVTLGTGLGSGFVVNGRLVYGHDSFAGELGHVVVQQSGRICGCGRKGCLETYVSATGIKRTVFKLLADNPCNSTFRKISYDELDAKMITDAALKGDPLAAEAFEYTGRLLGQALANAVTFTSPEAIFLFGGLAKAGKYIFEPTQRAMEQSILQTFRNKVKLLPSGIDGENAAVLGASALVWAETDGRQVC